MIKKFNEFINEGKLNEAITIDFKEYDDYYPDYIQDMNFEELFIPFSSILDSDYKIDWKNANVLVFSVFLEELKNRLKNGEKIDDDFKNKLKSLRIRFENAKKKYDSDDAVMYKEDFNFDALISELKKMKFKNF